MIEEGLQRRVAGIYAAALDDAVMHVSGKGRGEIATRYANDSELFRQQALLLEVIERRQQLALGEVAGGAEDDHDTRFGYALIFFGIDGLGLRQRLFYFSHATSPKDRK